MEYISEFHTSEGIPGLPSRNLATEEAAWHRHPAIQKLMLQKSHCSPSSLLFRYAVCKVDQMLMEKPFDLVITDMTMPRLTGADLARELHEMHPNLPLIPCTGFSVKINEERTGSLGIQGLLMKPFAWRQLAELIRKVLSAKD